MCFKKLEVLNFRYFVIGFLKSYIYGISFVKINKGNIINSFKYFIF